jgi:NAD(P)H-flavin reductase
VDEVSAFERRLRQDALRRADEVGGTELGKLFRRVADRRSSRSTGAAPPIARRTAEPVAPVEADAPAAGASVEGAPGTVLAVEPLGPTVRILRIGKPAGFTYRAGQHVKLGAPGGKSASFSIASAPHDAHLEFCVELVPDGRVTPALFRLAPGDAVELGDRPKGSFTLDESVPRHVMVATVTGIAPLRSMLRDALHRGVDADFVVLHGASFGHELPYFDELLALAASNARVEYRPTVSRDTAENSGWPHERGRVDDLARRVAPDHATAGTRVYACGNPGMVEQVSGDLGAGGFAVSTEKFD